METERRLSHRLVNFWQQIKGDRLLPAERDIRRALIEDLWDHCFLIHLRQGQSLQGGVFYSYNFVGSALDELFDPDAQGGSGQLTSLPADRLAEIFQEVTMTKLPVVENVEFFKLPDGKTIKYRQCLLPLGTPEGHVQSLFGGVRWKVE